MRIAQIAPLTESVPPKLYGGTERVVSYLTEELVRRGENVTLFASADSVSTARLMPMCSRALRWDREVSDVMAFHFHMLQQVFLCSEEFDILHFHLDYWPFALFAHQPTPFLGTLHGRLDLPELWPVYRANLDVPVVSVSEAQRSPMPWVNWVATIHHGIPGRLLAPSSVRPSYLAFLGRISPEKGVDTAIDIAGRCGVPLKIAAKVDRVDRDYFEQQIRPLMSLPHVEFLGEISDTDKTEFLSGAHALLQTGTWPEPFGLVMIEAMACGTPVIAFHHGSVPEVVEHGLTGFIVNGVDEAVNAIYRIARLSRSSVRRRFEERFTAERMAEDYLRVYGRVVSYRSAARRAVRNRKPSASPVG